MYGDLGAQQEAWKKIGYVRTSADVRVSNRPCFLFHACLSSSNVGASTAVIRDGHDTGGDAVIDLAAPTSDKDDRYFFPPLFFKKGLYVDVGSNVTSVLVQWLPYERGE